MTEEKSVAEYLVETLENLQQVIELMQGYRARLMAVGFSDEIAQEMCVTLHEKIWSNVSNA